MAGIPTGADPLAAVRSLAEAGANQRGTTLLDAGLRLFDLPGRPTPLDPADSRPSSAISPFELGRTYELLLTPTARRKKGAHLTPELIARNLVAMMPAPRPTDRVLDPSVGGAAFLLAAADQLIDAGAKPVAVLEQLNGFDIDAGAVAVAEAALALWTIDHGIAPGPCPALVHADGLLDRLPLVERVVGNPPFLNQLRSSSSHTTQRRSALRERWGELVGTYTDDAWLFLAAGLDSLTDDGALAMVQPVSILAARHGAEVRQRVHEHASLSGLWLAREQVFDAAVQVCGVVLSRRTSAQSVTRAVGADFDPVPALDYQPRPDQWGSAVAAAMDIPDVQFGRADTAGTVGDLATATAGFRDQFYGFVPFVSDDPAAATDMPKLVTVGMIDVLALRWGEREFKFAKRGFVRPVIDLERLRAEDPSLGDWVAARQRPKLLMATQTRVVEVWVDEQGDAIPATPVLSIEPLVDDQDTLWKLAAVLSAPAVSAHLLASKFGTAMSLNAMKPAARDVLALPLPGNADAWHDASQLLQLSDAPLAEFGAAMDRAYGIDDPALTPWWHDRVPNRSSR